MKICSLIKETFPHCIQRPKILVEIFNHIKMYIDGTEQKGGLSFNLPVMKTDFSTASRIHHLPAITHDVFWWIMSA